MCNRKWPCLRILDISINFETTCYEHPKPEREPVSIYLGNLLEAVKILFMIHYDKFKPRTYTLNVFCLKFQETSVSRMSSNVLMVLAFLGDGLVTITVTVSLMKTRKIVQNVLKKSSGDLN